MINSINLFKNIKHKTLMCVQNFVQATDIFAPKLNILQKDVFEYSSTKGFPDVLRYNPRITESFWNSGIKDDRLAYLGTEYRAYNYEGYDTKFPAEYVCIDSKGDRRLKPHIYLNLIQVKPEFARQGVYKNVIKKLKLLSLIEEGCEGRIILDSRKIGGNDIPDIPSPSLAHWKSGFRFVDEESNKIMQKVLKGELPLEQAPEGSMYYAFD